MIAVAPGAGLRERNKAEKLGRIRRAARELFIEKGYDQTTTREIARRADVALGTLFTYAADKRDLLFLIFNDELERLAEEAFGGIPAELPLVDQFAAAFRRFYVFFARQPDLSRFMLRELAFYVAGPEARRFQEHRGDLLRRLARVVEEAGAARRIGTAEDGVVVAQAVFSIYAGEIRRWLGEDDALDVEEGLRALRRMLRLLVSGLKPREGEV